MSEDGKEQQDQGSGALPQRQPVFLLPWPVTALCGLLLAVQLADSLVLNDQGREVLLTWFAFVPYRVIAPANLDGGLWPLLWTPFTHAFLHAGWEHVGLNTVWLAIFATPITQRYGALRMLHPVPGRGLHRRARLRGDDAAGPAGADRRLGRRRRADRGGGALHLPAARRGHRSGYG